MDRVDKSISVTEGPVVAVDLDDGATLPEYASPGSAGADLSAHIDGTITIPPGGRAAVPTGLRIAIPRGYEGQVRPRSGLALKHGIGVLNSPGTIDSDYRGELQIILMNYGEKDFQITSGDRIAQLVIAAVERADYISSSRLDETERGDGGFGSTGVSG